MGRYSSKESEQFTDLQRLVALLGREDVRRALHDLTLSRTSISDVAVPAGLSQDETVALATAVKRVAAVYSPIPDREGRRHWYACTPRIRHALGVIDRYCTTDSLLYQTTRSRAGTRFLVQSNVDETVATAQLDGVDIDAGAAKDLLLTQRQPRTMEERLLVNQFRLTEQLGQLADRPWTPETLLEIYARLAHGLPASMAHADDHDRWTERQAMLADVCRYANTPNAEACEHPATTALIIRAVIAYWHTFPAYNGMMSRILFRFYALQQGYPVLGAIPISQSELRLLEHPHRQEEASPQSAELLEAYHESDATRWLDTQVTLLNHALDQFRMRMQRAATIDAAVVRELQEDASLNHRQRSIVSRALRLAGGAFRIAYHRTAHRIGYATAHRDFAELVRLGYLGEELEGRRKVFRAGPLLKERIGVLADVGREEDYDVPLPPELIGQGPME
jgi:Fic family protein